MKKIYVWCLLIILTTAVVLGIRKEVCASDTTDNVNVTIPTSMSIVFAEDGTNQISDFIIENATTNALTIDTIRLTECNEWRVVSKETTIPVNTKEIVFQVEEQCLSAGENAVNIAVPENSKKGLNIQIDRGAWTYSDILETALELEMQYSFVEKEKVAYAIYLQEDTSLRFVRSENEIKVGDIYDGKTVEGVYTGFEEDVYDSDVEVPWYDGNYYSTRIVTKVIVEDDIAPVSTAYWFNWMYDCAIFHLEKLDTSNVTDMSYMFGWAGYDASTVELYGVDNFDVSNVIEMNYMFAYVARNTDSFALDLSGWNVSNVNNMYYMFAGTGYYAETFWLGDLRKWDVSSVINMGSMFRQTGYEADWHLDCSGWNVSKVTYYTRFNYGVALKVSAPEWVN